MLDIIRGFALLNMIFYHLLYDLVYIFGYRLSWFSIRQAFAWQQMICSTFIFVAGISFTLSKKPLKNGMILMVCAIILNLATFLVIPDEFIVFGILHFLAAAIFLTFLLRSALKLIPAQIGLPIAVFLFILFKNLPSGYLSFFSLFKFALSPSLFESSYLFFLGLPNHNFASADYFPIIPWWFLYLAGFYGMGLFSSLSKKPRHQHNTKGKLRQVLSSSLGLMGRHSLLIYMLHQPIIYGLLFLVLFFS